MRDKWGLSRLLGAKCQRWFIYDAQPALSSASRTHFDAPPIAYRS